MGTDRVSCALCFWVYFLHIYIHIYIYTYITLHLYTCIGICIYTLHDTVRVDPGWWLSATMLAQQYTAMSSNELEEEVSQRRLSLIKLNHETMPREAAVKARKNLQKRLRDSDSMFDQCFPKEDLLEVSAKRLRAVTTALGVTQGDQTRGTLVSNLRAFANQRYKGHLVRVESRKQDDV